MPVLTIFRSFAEVRQDFIDHDRALSVKHDRGSGDKSLGLLIKRLDII
jgi:hypothetical protein